MIMTKTKAWNWQFFLFVFKDKILAFIHNLFIQLVARDKNETSRKFIFSLWKCN